MNRYNVPVFPPFESLRREQLSVAFGLDKNSVTLDQVQPVMAELLIQEKGIILFSGRSPQILLRPQVLSWMQQTANEFRLLKKTIFHGVYLFDRFTEVHHIDNAQIHLLALVCLNIASKMEERECTLPKMRILATRLPAGTDYSTALFILMERFVLKHFDWRIIYPTVINFLEYYVLFALGLEDTTVAAEENNNTTAAEVPCNGVLREHLLNWQLSTYSGLPVRHRFLGKSLSERLAMMMETVDSALEFGLTEPSRIFRPSMVASACIMLGRESVGLKSWTLELQLLTTFNQSMVEECVQIYFGQKVEHPESFIKEDGVSRK